MRVMAEEKGMINASKDIDAWNKADIFVQLKIIRLLIQVDRYETIAKFGTEEMDEDINYSEVYLKKRRCEALERLHHSLSQIIGNTKFVIRDKFDKEDYQRHEKEIDNLEKYIGEAFTHVEDKVTKEEDIEINEKLFKILLRRLKKIKDEQLFYLNSSGVIFRISDEIDLDKIMNAIVEGG